METEILYTNEVAEVIEEGDYITTDGRTFYQDGHLTLTVEADAHVWTALMNHMHAMKFYPNVWFVNGDESHILMNPMDE